jgi:hypothetical protein
MSNFAKVYRNRADERHFSPPLLKKMIHGCMQKKCSKEKQSCHANVAKYLQPKETGKVENIPHGEKQNFHVSNN